MFQGSQYMPETSCMKKVYLYIKNMCLKTALKALRFSGFRVFGCENFSGPSRNGPQARIVSSNLIIWQRQITFSAFNIKPSTI